MATIARLTTTICKSSVKVGTAGLRTASSKEKTVNVSYILGIKYGLLLCLLFFFFPHSPPWNIVCLYNWPMFAIQENWVSQGIA